MKAVLACVGIALLSACASTPTTPVVVDSAPTTAPMMYDNRTEYPLASRKHWDAAHCMTRNAGRMDRSYIAISRPMLPRVVERRPVESETHEIVVVTYGTWGEKTHPEAQNIGLGMSARAIAVAQVHTRGDRTYASVWTESRVREDFVRKLIEGC